MSLVAPSNPPFAAIPLIFPLPTFYFPTPLPFVTCPAPATDPLPAVQKLVAIAAAAAPGGGTHQTARANRALRRAAFVAIRPSRSRPIRSLHVVHSALIVIVIVVILWQRRRGRR